MLFALFSCHGRSIMLSSREAHHPFLLLVIHVFSTPRGHQCHVPASMSTSASASVCVHMFNFLPYSILLNRICVSFLLNLAHRVNAVDPSQHSSIEMMREQHHHQQSALHHPASSGVGASTPTTLLGRGPPPRILLHSHTTTEGMEWQWGVGCECG
jgi:hypothetical protein